MLHIHPRQGRGFTLTQLSHILFGVLIIAEQIPYKLTNVKCEPEAQKCKSLCLVRPGQMQVSKGFKDLEKKKWWQ